MKIKYIFSLTSHFFSSSSNSVHSLKKFKMKSEIWMVCRKFCTVFTEWADCYVMTVPFMLCKMDGKIQSQLFLRKGKFAWAVLISNLGVWNESTCLEKYHLEKEPLCNISQAWIWMFSTTRENSITCLVFLSKNSLKLFSRVYESV